MQEYQYMWFKESLGMSDSEAQFTGRALNTVQFVGIILGNLISLAYAKVFGRKGGLLMNTFTSLFSVLFSGYCKYFNSDGLLYLGRILMGVKSGNGNILCPLYLMEISPIKIRGALGATFEFGVTLGIGVGLMLGRLVPNQHIWPIVYSLNAVPSFIALLMLPLCPESPKFMYVVKGNEVEARKAYRWLRGNRSIEREFQVLKDSRKKIISEATIKDLLNNELLRSSMMLCIVLTISAELSGYINVIMYISEYQRDMTPESEETANIITETFQITAGLAGCVLSLFVLYYCRRKVALISGFSTLAVLYLVACIAILYDRKSLMIPLYLCWSIAIVAWKTGIVTMCLIMPSLVFNIVDSPQGYAISRTIGTSSQLIYQLFLYSIQKRLHGFMFLNYAIANIAFAYYTWKKVPETKDSSLEVIQNRIATLHQLKMRKKPE